MPRLQPLVGLIVIMTIAYAFRPTAARSTAARSRGARLQIVFALLVLKTTVGQRVFRRSGGDQPPARISRRRIELRVRPLGDKDVWPRIMTTCSARKARRTASVRVPGAADDHLHRRSVAIFITSASCSWSCALRGQ
jgi:hypothetical protein